MINQSPNQTEQNRTQPNQTTKPKTIKLPQEDKSYSQPTQFPTNNETPWCSRLSAEKWLKSPDYVSVCPACGTIWRREVKEVSGVAEVTAPLPCARHTGPWLLTEEHTFLAFFFPLECLWGREKKQNLFKLRLSNLPGLLIKDPQQGSVPLLAAFQKRSRAKPHLSSCGQSAGRNSPVPWLRIIPLTPARLKLFAALLRLDGERRAKERLAVKRKRVPQTKTDGRNGEKKKGGAGARSQHSSRSPSREPSRAAGLRCPGM